MQTLASVSRKFLCWETTCLKHGAYRLANIRCEDVSPALTGFTDCTCDPQFVDELQNVQKLMGAETGLWLGMKKNTANCTERLAFLVE